MPSSSPLVFLASSDDSAWSIPWIIGVVAFIGFFVWLSFYLEKKRAEAMKGVAEQLRLEYRDKDGLKPEGIAHFHLGSQGHGREVRNVMVGRAGETEVMVFDYKYVVGHGKNSSTYQTTAVRFTTAGWSLPHFQMRPEGIFHKIGAVFGGKDINFDSHPVFSKMFLLKGEDEAAIRSLFDEPVLSALEQKKGVSVEGWGQELLFYRSRKRPKPPEVPGLLAEAHGVYAHFADAASRRG